MITRTYVANFGTAKGGLATQVTYKLPGGTATNVGVIEAVIGSGSYEVTVTHADALSGVIVWNPNDGSGVLACETINPVALDLAQPVPDTQAATVGGALAGSWANAWGKAVRDIGNRLLKAWGPGNASVTASKVFNLDSGTNPTSRS